MATESKTKPNLMLVAAIAGIFLILQGQGIIKVDPQPQPSPVPAPVVVPIPPQPTPPNPSPTPVPDPTPKPSPDPQPIVVIEDFPSLPTTYDAVSQPINASLFKKETAEDALHLARYFRDSATALRNDPTITSNAHFIKVYNQSLLSASNYYGLRERNKGLAKAIDDVLATQGLDIATWGEPERKKMAEAMDAISYRLAKVYEELTAPTPSTDKVA